MLQSVFRRQTGSEWRTVTNVVFGLRNRWLSRGSGSKEPDRCPQSTHNIGIVAHIDAGKTTTTERMLYCAGLTSHVGNVDSGNTVMDYLPPERERGITISSAVISLPWGCHTLNLVDTPGHADFTFEVERVLHVLDGAVALLDASAGVEAQTLSVWRQVKRYHIPCIAYVNKMDNPRASLHDAVRSVKERLGVQPLLTQLSLGIGRDFRGVVDLVHSCALIWPENDRGTSFSHVPLEDLPQDVQRDVHHYREQLLEQVAMADDTLAALLLQNDEATVDPNDLVSGIRRACVSGTAMPVLCGSALRGVAIQPLMDAITAYLPVARELAWSVPAVAHRLCAYAFKQVYDVQRGVLVYLRVFSGSLRPHTTIYNASRHTRERVTRVLQAQADQLQEVREASDGSIAVAVGLKHTFTGDTLVLSVAVARALEKEDMDSLLAPPAIPPPVFFCTVEPSSASGQRRLDHALQLLSRDDPSLRVATDQDTGQTVLSGMGELHLEIVQDHLQRVYGVECSLGQLQVAYREGLAQEVKATDELKYTLGSVRHSVVATVTLSPGEAGVHVIFSSRAGLGDTERQALSSAVEGCLTQGPILGCPVDGVTVSVQELIRSEGVSLPVLCNALTHTIQKALRATEMRLMEPMTELEVTVPEKYVGAVLSDLTTLRRGQVVGVAEGSEGERVVSAHAPLATLLEYASGLRSLTSGTGSFTMVSSGHSAVDQHQQNIIMKQLRGY